MQDSVQPCPHCGGTGELRGSWYVEQRYQDCRDLVGPFAGRAEAEAEARRIDPGTGNPRCAAVWLPEDKE